MPLHNIMHQVAMETSPADRNFSDQNGPFRWNVCSVKPQFTPIWDFSHHLDIIHIIHYSTPFLIIKYEKIPMISFRVMCYHGNPARFWLKICIFPPFCYEPYKFTLILWLSQIFPRHGIMSVLKHYDKCLSYKKKKKFQWFRFQIETKTGVKPNLGNHHWRAPAAVWCFFTWYTPLKQSCTHSIQSSNLYWFICSIVSEDLLHQLVLTPTPI